jgi:hypothetical protein
MKHTVSITWNWKNRLAHTRQIIIADWLSYAVTDPLMTPVLINVIWDEVPTMVEIAIFWFQIHSTNGQNSLHRKWRTGNQYRLFYWWNLTWIHWTFRLHWHIQRIFIRLFPLAIVLYILLNTNSDYPFENFQSFLVNSIPCRDMFTTTWQKVCKWLPTSEWLPVGF